MILWPWTVTWLYLHVVLRECNITAEFAKCMIKEYIIHPAVFQGPRVWPSSVHQFGAFCAWTDLNILCCAENFATYTHIKVIKQTQTTDLAIKLIINWYINNIDSGNLPRSLFRHALCVSAIGVTYELTGLIT